MANTRRRRCRSISQKALEVGYRHIDTAQGYKTKPVLVNDQRKRHSREELS